MMDKFKNKYAFIWLIISFVIAFIQYTITLYFSFGKALAFRVVILYTCHNCSINIFNWNKTVKNFQK